jgi:hypothetical protein
MENAAREKAELARPNDYSFVVHFDCNFPAKHDEALIGLLVRVDTVVNPPLPAVVVPNLKTIRGDTNFVWRNAARQERAE